MMSMETTYWNGIRYSRNVLVYLLQGKSSRIIGGSGARVAGKCPTERPAELFLDAPPVRA